MLPTSPDEINCQFSRSNGHSGSKCTSQLDDARSVHTRVASTDKCLCRCEGGRAVGQSACSPPDAECAPTNGATEMHRSVPAENIVYKRRGCVRGARVLMTTGISEFNKGQWFRHRTRLIFTRTFALRIKISVIFIQHATAVEGAFYTIPSRSRYSSRRRSQSSESLCANASRFQTATVTFRPILVTNANAKIAENQDGRQKCTPQTSKRERGPPTRRFPCTGRDCRAPGNSWPSLVVGVEETPASTFRTMRGHVTLALLFKSCRFTIVHDPGRGRGGV